MAMKKDFTTKHGLTCVDAYGRVEQISLNKSGMTADVRWRKDAQSVPFHAQTFEVPLDLSGPNPIAQSYSHLKTLPEFAGAVDC